MKNNFNPQGHGEGLYYKQLDGIRFIAVAVVMIDHWLGETIRVPIGFFGVNTFFVLSGFLITGILLKAKLKNEATGASQMGSIKSFVVRRSLRIFPIYYLTILVLALLHVPPVREYLVWYLTYTVNLLVVVRQQWLGSTDHLWSLAVEEQFYLFFPWLVLFAPKRWLLPSFYALIGGAILLRLVLWRAGYSWVVPFCLTPATFDALVAGSVLAHLHTFSPAVLPRVRRVFAVLAAVSVVACVWIASLPADAPRPDFGVDVLLRALFSVIGFWLIAQAVAGFTGPVRAFLENRAVVYFGRISYGLYIYHNFVYSYYHTPDTHPTARLLRWLGRTAPALAESALFRMALFFTLCVGLATVSWYLIEKPLNGLKRYFKY
jgi:peptidoglycan/LPS O-acetylase OafA/YrhL